MSISMRKLGVLALVGAVLLVFGMLRASGPTKTSEAAYIAPGGIAAFPSFFPGIPSVVDQSAPAMIPADQPGNQAMIDVFADPGNVVFPNNGAIFDSNCNIQTAGMWPLPLNVGSVCFKVHAVNLETMELGPTAAKFAASGSDRLLCDESSLCDLDGIAADGAMAVLLNGGGKDELLQVDATDESGDTRTVQVITVKTMIALPPVVEPSQTELIPGMEGLSVIGYRCSNVGASTNTLFTKVAGTWFPSSLQGMSDAVEGTSIGLPLGLNEGAGPFYGCGQNTQTNTLDNLVQFQTDIGQMSMQPLLLGPAGFVSLAIPGFDCPQGKSVSIQDGSATPWSSFGLLPGPPYQMQNCDFDAAPNGTVGYLVVRTADVGQATITGQQGGTASSTIQTYVNFIGEPSAGLINIMLYGETPPATLPDAVSPLSPIKVTAVVLSPTLNPIAGKTVSCALDPVSGLFSLLLDRDTTGADGMAHFTLVPTGLPGTEITLSCKLEGYPDIAPVIHKFTVSLTPNLQTVPLVEGCNPESATWADGTLIATVANAVAPAAALDAIWKFDAASSTWQGYAPGVPADVNNLVSVNRLDAIFFCVNAAATVQRPVI